MKRNAASLAVAFSIVCGTFAGCGEDLVDSKARIQLLWGCIPSFSAATANVVSYCLTILDNPQQNRPTDGCASTLEGLRIKVKAATSPVHVKIEGIDQGGNTLVQGISPPVVLDPERETNVPVPMAPTVADKSSMALLVWGDSGCELLPFPVSNHTATVFPSGHVLVVGTDQIDVDSTQTAFLLDSVARSAHPLSTVGADTLYRSQHYAGLFDDGRVLLAGGHTTAIGFFPEDIYTFQGIPALMRAYDRTQDYSSVSQFNRISGVELAYPRPIALGEVFFGDQALIYSEGDRPEMFFGDTNTRAMLGGGVSQAFPATGSAPGLAVFPDRIRAVLLGGANNHAGVLRVSEGNPNVSFVAFSSGTTFGMRKAPVGVALDNERALFFGGTVNDADTPILLADTRSGTVTPVPAPAGFPTEGFTADLLADGSVLVAGGFSPRVGFVAGKTFIVKPVQGGDFSILEGPSL
ncbi:MAG: hypothetical protein GYA21_00535, partial [Myxococcales bacterium]|nr:hypothetical protein [Myxococcales bacterium]